MSALSRATASPSRNRTARSARNFTDNWVRENPSGNGPRVPGLPLSLLWSYGAITWL
nr:hypothetical protein [uncultured bacterium]